MKDTTFTKKIRIFTRWSSLSTAITKSIAIPTLNSKYLTASWKHIEDIIKYLNSTSNQRNISLEENTTYQNILHDISNIDHNISVYLNSNIAVDGKKDDYLNKEIASFYARPITTKDIRPMLLSSSTLAGIKVLNLIPETINKLNTEPTAIQETSSRKLYRKTEKLIINNKNINNNDKSNVIKIAKQDTKGTMNLSTTISVGPTISKVISNFTNTTPLLQTGIMVDHKSWENVVQVAPVMAIILNNSDSLPISKIKNTREETIKRAKEQKSARKKRHIQALRIENSQPRNITKKPTVSTETEPLFRITDIQDLARLVEVQDDEMQGRVALRYLRNYVGPTMFNLCDFSEPKARQTFMFNTSRIVIAVNNFTLDHMLLVVTPAQTLIRGPSRCPPAHLECQVLGTRVCIDNTNSCDGVPNCGSYDIYDEDRLMCGLTKGLQHNVYLAAFTLLAVLLTMLYTIYYWLKRCVPRVSEAFFIYADTSENTLYLDTIMHSPKDLDDASSKLVFPVHDYDDDILYVEKETDLRRNIYFRLLRNCLKFLCCKKRRDSQSRGIRVEYESKDKPTRLFSFTELELRKFTPNLKDEEIQTGDGYEVPSQGELKINNEPDNDVFITFNTEKNLTENYSSELNLIKLAKQTRSLSQCDSISFERKETKMNRRDALITDDEKEIKSTVYERQSDNSLQSPVVPVTFEVHPGKTKKQIDERRLRFDDAPIMIPSEDAEDELPGPSIARRSVVLGAVQLSKQDLDTITEIEESASSSKDFMRFWGKKGKKKDKISKHS